MDASTFRGRAESAGVRSTWFIDAASGVIPDSFQPPVPDEHPLRQITICVMVLADDSCVVGSANVTGDVGMELAFSRALTKAIDASTVFSR